jgi:pimeloyl-ACP methyl ester carboxylesterase
VITANTPFVPGAHGYAYDRQRMEREAYVELRGRRQRYLEAGSGWPVVLLHAFPLNADVWRPQLERVPRGWRFLAPDLRGFGKGMLPSSSFSIADIADDVGAFLDVLEIENAVIGGLSMGGYVLMQLYRTAPERFTAMVLANTKASPDTPEGRAAREQMAALVRREGLKAVADQMLPNLLGATSHRARPQLEPLVRRLIESNTTEGIEAAIHAIKDRPDSLPTLARSAVPALVITGEEDAIIPVSESEAMQRTMPRALMTVLPSAGHLSGLEVPDDFAEALGNFLRSNL